MLISKSSHVERRLTSSAFFLFSATHFLQVYFYSLQYEWTAIDLTATVRYKSKLQWEMYEWEKKVMIVAKENKIDWRSDSRLVDFFQLRRNLHKYSRGTFRYYLNYSKNLQHVMSHNCIIVLSQFHSHMAVQCSVVMTTEIPSTQCEPHLGRSCSMHFQLWWPLAIKN